MGVLGGRTPGSDDLRGYCLVRMPFSFQFRNLYLHLLSNELVDVFPVGTWYVDRVTAEKMEHDYA